MSEAYLLSQRRAFAKLDGNDDGQPGFEEFGAKTTTNSPPAHKATRIAVRR